MTDEQRTEDEVLNTWAEKALFIAFNEGMDKGLSPENAMEYAVDVLTSILEDAIKSRERVDKIKEGFNAPIDREI